MTFQQLSQQTAPRRGQSQVRAFFGLFLVALLCTPAAFAQLSGKGEIKGLVTDPTGAAIPGAKVVVTSTTRGTKSNQTTTSAGDYDVSPLNADTYTITVSAPGFKTTTQQNVTVNALEIAAVNVTLSLGDADQSITVTEAPPQLETGDATLGATMSQETYSALPISMGAAGAPDQRRASDYVTLMPGVQNNETSNNQTDNTGPVNGSGSKGGASGVYIEGIPFINVSEEGDNRFVWTAVSVDAVNQLQVQTSGYSAIYEGQGVQNFDIKGGTNTIHGAVYEYFRNTALDSWGFYAPGQINPAVGHATKPSEHMNEYGILLSGPIIKNKLFFFGNYDGFRYAKGAIPSLTTYPTLAERNGDFSALGVNIYQPKTAASSSTNQPAQYMGCGGTTPNVICSSQFSAVASKINALLPAPALYANQNATNNVLAGLPFGLDNWETTNRLDYTMNSRHNMSLIIAAGRQASVGPAPQTTTGRNNGPLPFNYGQGYAPKTHVFMFEDAYVINQHLVNQFKYGFARYAAPTFNLNNNSADSSGALGVGGLPIGQATTSFPEVTFAGTDAPAQWGGDVGSVANANSYDLIDNLQWVIGKHSITFGGEIAWLQYNYTSDTGGSSPLILATAQSETGNFTASTTTTPSTTINANTGLAYASFLTGQIDKGSFVQNAIPETGARFRPISPYVQDDWKVNSRLTLNLGVRYDYYPTYTEAHNTLSYFNPTATNAAGTDGTLEFAGNGTNTCNCNTPVKTYKKQFGPRLGFAFQSDPKTVWRGSWGVMYTHGNGVAGAAVSRTGTGFVGFQAAPATTSVNGVPNFLLDSGYPAYSAPASTPAAVLNGPNYALGYSSLAAFTGTPQSVAYGDPYLGGRAPQYINYTFGFEHQITQNLVLNATYVGSQGHFESPDSSTARGQYSNELDPKYLSLGSFLSTKISALPVNFFANNGLPQPTNFLSSQTLSQELKPYPNYSSITDTYGNVANSNYHSLQVSVTQRPHKGLSFMVNYIWSKSLDNGGTFRSGYALPASLLNGSKSYKVDHIEYGVSTSNQPQHLIATMVYDLPFGAQGFGSSSRIGRMLGSNFKFSGIAQVYSGSPLAITGSACQTNPAQSTCNPTLNPAFSGNSHINGKWGTGATATSSPSYLSSNAFVPIATLTATGSPYAYTFGNAPRTAPFGMYGPGNYDVDVSLRRAFVMPHFSKSHLTIEADLYNVSNHTTFGGIGTVFGSSNFGQVTTQANNSRDAQLSGRFEF